MGGFAIIEHDWNLYFQNVLSDFKELKDFYPFSFLTILPTAVPTLAQVRVVAANKDLINLARAVETDFLGEFTRELHIVIPIDYRESGCKVYGAKWVDITKLEYKDIHFYQDSRLGDYGYELCVGTPESFPKIKNVILENIRTAEYMLIAYERIMTGSSNKLDLFAYAHGETGRKQYNKNSYRMRRKS